MVELLAKLIAWKVVILRYIGLSWGQVVKKWNESQAQLPNQLMEDSR